MDMISHSVMAHMLLLGSCKEVIVTALSKPITSSDELSVLLALLAFIVLCLSFAWDGLVRHRVFLAGFRPLGIRGAVFGPLPSVIVGIIGALFATITALFSWFVAIQFAASCRGSWNCIGSSLLHVDFYAWALVFIWGGYALLAQLGALQGPKRELCVGVTYDPRRAHRAVRRDLRQRGLGKLSNERIYALEEAVAEYMRGKNWLPPLEGTSHMPPRTTATQDVMIDNLRQDPLYVKANPSERAAMETLLIYFKDLD